jgi:hypothetical protein
MASTNPKQNSSALIFINCLWRYMLYAYWYFFLLLIKLMSRPWFPSAYTGILFWPTEEVSITCCDTSLLVNSPSIKILIPALFSLSFLLSSVLVFGHASRIGQLWELHYLSPIESFSCKWPLQFGPFCRYIACLVLHIYTSIMCV